MSLFTKIRAAFQGGTPSFNDLERKILEALQAELAPEVAARLQQRMERVTLVQRLDGGREVNLYQMNNGKPVLDESTRLSDEKGENVFSTFEFTAQPAGRVRGKIWTVDGRFFSMEFDKAVENVSAADVQNVVIRIKKDGTA